MSNTVTGESPCPNCGSTECISLVRDTVNGITCEEDLYCKVCLRHVGFFSYGSYFDGDGTVMRAADEEKVARANQRLLGQASEIDSNFF